jgi:hypothetical protein
VVAEVGRRLGTPFMPWQELVAEVAFEVDDDGRLAYDEVVVVVGRQQGKTAMTMAAAVHRLVPLVRSHGPQRATFTMQNRTKARNKLERDYAPRLRRSRSFREVSRYGRPANSVEWRLGMNSGSEHIQFGGASYLQIDTPGRSGSHGDTLDLGLIDEAFAHEDDTVEGAMSPAMVTRRDRQMWVLSAAGDGKSKYLWRKILAGREACRTGAHGRTAYFEWSAPDGDDPGSPVTWSACCPALGLTVEESALASEWERALRGGVEGVNTFRRAYLSQWPEVPILEEDLAWRVIAEADWKACEQPRHRGKPAGMSYGLDVDVSAKGETWCSIGASDGFHHELVTPLDARPGTGWVVEACVARRDRFRELLVEPSGPAGDLLVPLRREGIRVREVTGREFGQACGGMVAAVRDRAMVHLGQPQLDMAVAGVEKRDLGDGAFRFSRTRSVVDIGPLVAVTLARWGTLRRRQAVH